MISLSFPHKNLDAQIPLPASKSESNRALIIQALSEEEITLHNLAEARDTQTMIRLLQSEGHVLDVLDAGTTMRFLTAYFAAVGRDQILTGTPRMCQRPIGLLVDSLRELGAEIEYWKQEGYPPLHIISKGGKMSGGKVSMPGNISSQFISAVLMISPTLPGGIKLELQGKITSKPYIEMTRALMAHFGAKSQWQGQTIVVPEQPYQSGSYEIEGDWSAASYWFSLVALSEGGSLTVKGLRKNSLQGDSAIVELAKDFGVSCEFTEEGILIQKVQTKLPKSLEIDFSTFPDLAQTIAVMGAALGIELSMTGLHTLRIKETDRIEALENELGKMGIRCESTEDSLIVKGKIQKSALIRTYDDHRMGMAFAPLAISLPSISLDEAEVVDKSYPSFWKHMKLAGTQIMGG